MSLAVQIMVNGTVSPDLCVCQIVISTHNSAVLYRTLATESSSDSFCASVTALQ
jgi:hypothetical protein